MGKEAKSSASSGTRKKHARKAGGDQPVLPLPGVKKAKAKKGEKALPKVKQYIPPTRPAPVQIDPLDSLGLASQLDKELVVILRRLAKKDAVTRTKAIEELRAWVDRDDTFGAESMVPVWVSEPPSSQRTTNIKYRPPCIRFSFSLASSFPLPQSTPFSPPPHPICISA